MANIPDSPITRKEKYLDAIANGTTEVPEPITREEEYLAWIALNGGGGGGGTGEVTGVKGSAESTFRKGNVSISPANIGLDKVNNTPDLNKPISNATQAALDLKVDKVEGKVLSDNNYSNDDKAIVDGVETELAKKVNKVEGKGLSTEDYTTEEKTKLAGLENYDDTALAERVTANETTISGKVDKVTGKGLSTNDYTDADKDIVDGVTSALAGKVDKETGKSLIDLTTVVDGASYDSENHLILFKNGSTTLFSLDAAAFVKDGMVDTVEITGGNLVITFNTDAGKQAISIPLTDIFDPANYYDKTATDNLLADKADKTSVIQFKTTTETDANNVWEETGYYIVNTSDMTNLPTTDTSMGYCLEVIRYGSYSNSIVIQIAYRGNPTTESPMYMRRRFNDVWTDWVAIAKKSEVTVKADKVSGATNGNFAGLDANGNLTDSGKKATDFATPENVQDSINTSADLLKDTVGWTGKNLLPYPYKDGARTFNGVTYVYNSDNTITVNGEATSVSWRTLTENFSFLELGKKYRLSGCPTGGSPSSYLIQLTYNDGVEKYIQDYGDGIEFTYIGDFIRLQIIVKENYTANNLVFKPMIRKADITDPTYEPFHESVETMYEEEVHGVNLLKQLHGTETKNGVTFTQNTDGSVTVNGTATVNTGHEMISTNDTGFNGSFRLPVGRYILSGCPKDGSWETYSLYFQMMDDNGTWLTQYKDEGNGVEFDITETNKDYRFLVSVRAQNGVAISNVKFYPMIRKADIEDGTYRPYNYQAIQNQLNSQGVLGAKNLLENNSVSETINGITFTLNSDGSVTAQGTPTGITRYSFTRKVNNEMDELPSELIGKSVIVSGGYTQNNGTLEISCITRNSSGQDISDHAPANGAKERQFTIESDAAYIRIYAIFDRNGNHTPVNVTMKPMLRLASDPDDTYVPYAPTNVKLNEEKMSYADNGVLGAKNFWSWQITNQTKNGVTWTQNTDGSVLANGATTDAQSDMYSLKFTFKKAGKYILTGKSNNVEVGLYNFQTSKWYWSNNTNPSILIDVPNTTDEWWFSVVVRTNKTVNNETIYPMLRLASDPDNTYQPYAMTNKQLTDHANKVSVYDNLSNFRVKKTVNSNRIDLIFTLAEPLVVGDNTLVTIQLVLNFGAGKLQLEGYTDQNTWVTFGIFSKDT